MKDKKIITKGDNFVFLIQCLIYNIGGTVFYLYKYVCDIFTDNPHKQYGNTAEKSNHGHQRSPTDDSRIVKVSIKGPKY